MGDSSLLNTSYGFNRVSYKGPLNFMLSYPLKALEKIQRRAAIWILGAFKTSPSEGIKTIIDLIPIKLHLQKLRGRVQLRALSLPLNHIIHTLMDSSFGSPYNCHPSSLSNFTNYQRKNIKGHLVDINNRSHRLFPVFSSTHPELSPGF